jgi:hypothetical protein
MGGRDVDPRGLLRLSGLDPLAERGPVAVAAVVEALVPGRELGPEDAEVVGADVELAVGGGGIDDLGTQRAAGLQRGVEARADLLVDLGLVEPWRDDESRALDALGARSRIWSMTTITNSVVGGSAVPGC